MLALLSVTLATPNPFDAAKTWYVNPANQHEIDSSIATTPAGPVRATLKQMRDIPSAYWIDKKSKIRGNTTDSLEGILEDASSQSPPPLVVFIFYDLPNRDCDAKSSNGEICCKANPDGTCNYDAQGDCAAGIDEYKTEYVEPFAKVLGRYSHVPVVIVVEPDSLPNIATNAAHPHCGNPATRAAYTQGVTYAVEQLAQHAPQATLYLDAAHGGWLGWENNAKSFVQLVASLNIASHLRGFSSNVANYQPLGKACPAAAFAGSMTPIAWCQQHQGDPCCNDPCGLLGQGNSGNSELNYVQMLTELLKQSSIGLTPHWIIDTGRNGVVQERHDCANWCNIRGAGAGVRPSAKVALPEMIDAYFWLKTPGESDGCTQTLPDGSACGRFDSMCSSADSIGSRSGEPRAPEAGKWFDYQIKQLAMNANLGPAPGPPAPPAPPSPPTPPGPSGCPGGTLQKCIGLCPANPPSAFHNCVKICTLNCHSKAKPFGTCASIAGSIALCEDGYRCERGLCMPTAARLAEAGGHGPFRAALEHAMEWNHSAVLGL